MPPKERGVQAGAVLVVAIVVGLVAATARAQSVERRDPACDSAVSAPTAEQLEQLELYRPFFGGFVDGAVTARAALSDQVTRALSHDAADVLEAVVAARRIEAALANQTSPGLADIRAAWLAAWLERAEAAEAAGFASEAADDASTAGRAFYRASAYYQVAGALDEDLSEAGSVARHQQSLDAMARALDQAAQPGTVLGRCTVVEIPYDETPPEPSLTPVTLHGYFCPSDKPDDSNTLLVQGDMSDTAEYLLATVGADAVAGGFNVLVFDGPGQGRTARRFGFPLRPDWEVVMRAVVDFVLDYDLGLDDGAKVPTTRLVAYGAGFGGHLMARAFANESRLSALVLAAPVFDAYQAQLCGISGDAALLAKYLDGSAASTAEFNQDYTAGLTEVDLGFALHASAAALSFGVGSGAPAAFFDQLQAYTLAGELAGVGDQPVFVGQPSLELTGQSQQLFDALPTPRDNSTKLYVMESSSGAGLPSAGYSAGGASAGFAFVQDVGLTNPTPSTGGTSPAGWIIMGILMAMALVLSGETKLPAPSPSALVPLPRSLPSPPLFPANPLSPPLPLPSLDVVAEG